MSDQMTEALRAQFAHVATSHGVDRFGWTHEQYLADAERLMNDPDGSVRALVNGHVLALLAEVRRLRDLLDAAGVSPAAMLREFHESFGLAMRETPGLADVPEDLLHLRGELLREEAKEYADAAEERDLIGIADALADVVYVAYGNALTYGIDLDAVLAEVHRANMSKLGLDGRPILREDGKVLKGPRYRAPDVAAVLAAQAPPVEATP